LYIGLRMINKIPKNLKNRQILKSISPFLKEENIILLTGPRQSGKTSLLYLLIKSLQKKVNPSQIVFFDLENVLTLDTLNKLKDFDDFVQILKAKDVDFNQRLYIFIDEVQYLNYPSSFLKYLHDHYKPKLKFIVSGSSSLEIKKKFRERLTGRIYQFNLFPLSFKEFLFFKNEKKPTRELFEEFVLFGGYPAISLKSDLTVKQKELSEIYSLYVKRDIKDFGNIEDITGFNKLVKLTANQIGNLINEVELANSSQLSRQTVRKYLFLLENTFVLKLIPPFFTNKRKELVKMPKVYFVDSGLRNAVLENYPLLSTMPDFPHLIENAIGIELIRKVSLEGGKIHFWRTQTKQEVDFIYLNQKEITPLEVKYANFKKPIIPKGLKAFINQYQPKLAFIITKNFDHKTEFKSTKIIFSSAYRLPFLNL
jgi:predicted AAA+ superfamily ATPase